MNHFAEVVRFNEAARGALPHRPTKLTLDETKLCLRLIIEESFETVEACLRPESAALVLMTTYKNKIQAVIAHLIDHSDVEQDSAALLDGLCDTIVVTMGMAALAGLPLNEGMGEVNGSNLAKIDPATGLCIKDAGGKIQKPPGWKKPDLESIISWSRLHGNRGDVHYEKIKPVSAALETALSSCGQFPENLAAHKKAGGVGQHE